MRSASSRVSAGPIGLINTYQRHDVLSGTLRAIANQTLPPRRLVIVDNGTDVDLQVHLADHPIHETSVVEILTPNENLGPAGGFSAALDHLVTAEDDIVVLFDDDDPPPRADLIAKLVERLSGLEADVAGVGLRGGNLSRHLGIVRPQADGPGLVPVDHLHGGYLPVYRARALQSVGGFDADLFWGFEELDLGRRLVSSGWKLFADSGLLSSVLGGYPKATAGWSAPHLSARSWRHYYRHRNLLRILRREKAWLAVALTISLRLVAKPLVLGIRNPRLASWHVTTNYKAIRDGVCRQRTSPTNV